MFDANASDDVDVESTLLTVRMTMRMRMMKVMDMILRMLIREKLMVRVTTMMIMLIFR